jgi:hypothetical protein
MKTPTQKNRIKIKRQSKSKRQNGGIPPISISTPENVTNNRRMRNYNYYSEFASPSFISTPSDDESNDNNRNVNFRRGSTRTRSESGDLFDNLVNRLDYSGVTSSPDYNLMLSDDLENNDSFMSIDSEPVDLIPGARTYEVISNLDPFISQKLDDELSEKMKQIPVNKLKYNMNKKVMDYINDEELSVKEFIKKDPINNIVIRDEDENYYFVDKETIRNNQETSDLFACNEATIGWTGITDLLEKTNTNFPLYNMNSVGIENYVFKPDIENLINHNDQLYYLIPSKTVVPSTVSKPILEIYQPNVTSANHCQTGKGGLVFRLIPIEKLKNRSIKRISKSMKTRKTIKKLKKTLK